jgi:hypothetical protein
MESPAHGAAPVWDEVVDLDDSSSGPEGDEDEVRPGPPYVHRI